MNFLPPRNFLNGTSPTTANYIRGAELPPLLSKVQYGIWSWLWYYWDFAPIKTQMDFAIALNCNCFASYYDFTSIFTGLTTRANMLARYKQIIDYAAANNCWFYAIGNPVEQVNPLITGLATPTTFRNEVKAWGNMLAGCPNVFGVDPINEGYTFTDISNQAWADSDFVSLAAGIYSDLKEIFGTGPNTIPITFSSPAGFSGGVGNAAVTFQTNTRATNIQPYCDYWEFHPYYPGMLSTDPNDSTPGWIMHDWPKKFILENGWEFSQLASCQSIYSSTKTFLDNRNDCVGCNAFTLYDYERVSLGGDQGIIDNSGAIRLSGTTYWPGWRVT